jgi:uncharacterized BrkB/YihY/UPF0761 family membrane protein
MPNPLTNILNAIQGGNSDVQQATGVKAATPASNVAAAAGAASAVPGAFSSIQNALSGFYDVLTNGKMWRSLGWLVLGILFIVAGLGLWFKGDIPVGDIVSAIAPEGG